MSCRALNGFGRSGLQERGRELSETVEKVEELHTYVERNQEFVQSYRERYRNGEKIASGFVESAINHDQRTQLFRREIRARRWM